MPRPRPRSSALRAPLDFILGTQGAVRALRVFSASSVPLSQAELARRAALSPSGVPALLSALEAAGVIAYVGRGRTRQVQLHLTHPLMAPLAQLFREEDNRWRVIQQRILAIAGSQSEHLISAWIEGPVTMDRDGFSDPLIVGFLSERPLPLAAQENVRQQSNILQAGQYVVIALRFHQRADLMRFTKARRSALENSIAVYGPAPIDLLLDAKPKKAKTVRGGARKTAMRNRRPSLRTIASRIADRIAREPEIVSRARAHIDRRLRLAGASERLALLEWQGLLDSLTSGQVASLLREDSERAEVLRQNLPFVDALSEKERAELFDAPSHQAVRKRS